MVVVEASGLGLRTRRGWVFRDVDLTAAAGELHAVTGPPGSGRTSLLLALAGRFPTSDGRLRRHGPAALGQVAGVHEPDPALTVAEHVRERLLLLGPAPGRRRRLAPVAAARARRAYRREALATALEGAGFADDAPLDPDIRGRDLTPVQRQVLGLVLATLSGPSLIVADDVDAGADAPERAWLWSALGRLAEQGYAVVASARAVEPDTPAIVHRLGEPPADPPPAGTVPAPRPAPARAVPAPGAAGPAAAESSAAEAHGGEAVEPADPPSEVEAARASTGTAGAAEPAAPAREPDVPCPTAAPPAAERAEVTR
ncbi:ATP-binding cassette domain-containing protein [Micromonospora sp. C28SCA-DRY-2]|uniref:ATP-binding cassette domain-containing protein n=1 Tax=Micromonospora sp. C28SCA-DRY-2 TaxID=3059522 RepID=UPI0026745767|nr:ATP-binding cassette domain-containing protein [Micromonospora sp. C28SCA-DRY-2]MDO3700623.1 ATP-binding cassette domain-containing protein [Micromonospora sp. C28SCA-DRY-2]